jgi:hypothetical protein
VVTRLLLFYPDGTIVEYAGMGYPNKIDHPIGTWAYNPELKGYPLQDPWSQLRMASWSQSDKSLQIDWVHYGPGRADPPKKFQMIALVHP